MIKNNIKERVNKKSISVMIGSVFLVIFAVAVSSIIYVWMGEYVKETTKSAQEDKSKYSLLSCAKFQPELLKANSVVKQYKVGEKVVGYNEYYDLELRNYNQEDVRNYQERINITEVVNTLGNNFKILDENNKPIRYCFEQYNGECNETFYQFPNGDVFIWINVSYMPKAQWGYEGKAFGFDSGIYVNISNPLFTTTKQLSLIAIAKPKPNKNNQDIPAVIDNHACSGGFYLEYSSSTLRYHLKNNDGTCSWDWDVNKYYNMIIYHNFTNKTAFLATTYNDLQKRLYKNANLMSIINYTQTWQLNLDHPYTYIGGNIGTVDNIYGYFNGTIDEVRVYNISLTDEEIFNCYVNASLCPSNGLVLYYDFEQCLDSSFNDVPCEDPSNPGNLNPQAVYVKDLSGNGNHGKIYGNPKIVPGIKGVLPGKIKLRFVKTTTSYALNGREVFPFYEDFNSNTLNTSIWQPSSACGNYSGYGVFNGSLWLWTYNQSSYNTVWCGVNKKSSNLTSPYNKGIILDAKVLSKKLFRFGIPFIDINWTHPYSNAEWSNNLYSNPVGLFNHHYYNTTQEVYTYRYENESLPTENDTIIMTRYALPYKLSGFKVSYGYNDYFTPVQKYFTTVYFPYWNISNYSISVWSHNTCSSWCYSNYSVDWIKERNYIDLPLNYSLFNYSKIPIYEPIYENYTSFTLVIGNNINLSLPISQITIKDAKNKEYCVYDVNATLKSNGITSLDVWNCSLPCDGTKNYEVIISTPCGSRIDYVNC